MRKGLRKHGFTTTRKVTERFTMSEMLKRSCGSNSIKVANYHFSWRAI